MPKLHNNQFRHIKKNSKKHSKAETEMFPEKRQFMVKWRNRNVSRKKGNLWSNGETAMFADKQFSAQDFPAAKHFAWTFIKITRF